MPQFDERLVRLSLEVNGQFKTYEGLHIVSTGTRYANPLQNEAEISVANLSKADADYLLTETSPFNKNRTIKLIRLEAGRKSTGLGKVFEGNIAAVAPSQPPDIILKFKCQANQYDKGKIIANQQAYSVPFSQVAKSVAGDLGLELNFQATDKNVSNYAFTGNSLKQVDKLQSLGAVQAYVDGNQLVVKDVRVPLTGHVRILDKNSGMIGIPELTEQGIKATYLLDNQTTLGGALQIKSEQYPTANGTYDIFKLSWNITTREVPFYWIAEGVRVDDKGKTVIPNNIKKKKGKRK